MKRIDAPQHPDAAQKALMRAELARPAGKPRTNAERDALLDLLVEAVFGEQAGP